MSTTYLLWYHSKSHQRDRFFLGVGKTEPFPGLEIQKPQWSYNKDESTIFETLAEAQAAKTFCEECQYTGLQIEPIDDKPIWVPSELVLVGPVQ